MDEARSMGQNNVQQRHSYFLCISIHVTMFCSLIYFQRYRDWVCLAGTSGDCMVQASAQNRVHDSRLLKALPSCVLNISKDGYSTTPLGNLFLCVTTLIVKTFFFFLIFKWNFLCFSLCLLLLISGHHREESVSVVFTAQSCIYVHV